MTRSASHAASETTHEGASGSAVDGEPRRLADDPILALGTLGTIRGDGEDPLAPSANLRRRQLASRLMESSQTAAALLALATLAVVVISVLEHAAGVLTIGFLTQGPPIPAEAPGGGIGPEIVGTAVLMLVATAIAMPLGVLIALYLTEFGARRWLTHAIQLVLDLLNGLPTIIVGLFVFGLLVVGRGQFGFAASLALAIIMLPLIARATQEVLLLVPMGMREAARALGISHWRTVRGVILPSALGGILTATVLALARAAGETAPLIFLSSVYGNGVYVQLFGQGVPNIPTYIYYASEGANPYGFERAWGAAFVLLAFIFLTGIGGRALLGRSRRRMLG